MTKHLQHLLVFATLLFASPISAQSGEFLVQASPLLARSEELLIPASAEMAKYPLHSATPMTVREMAKLGLHPMVLKEQWVGLNYYRNVSRFTLDTLPVGDLVLADSAGTPWYRVSCVNRLVTLTKCPNCLALLTKSAGDGPKEGVGDSFSSLFAGSPVADSALRNKEPGFWSGVADNFGRLMDRTKDVLSWLLPLLLWLLLLGLIVLGLVSLFRWLRGSGPSGGATPPGPQAPPVSNQVATPPAPTPAPVVPTPVPQTPAAPVAPQQALTTPAPVTSVSAEAPTNGASYIHFDPADGRTQNRDILRFSGDLRDVSYRRENGVVTIRFISK